MKNIIIPEIGIFTKISTSQTGSRVNARKRIRIVKGRNTYSQRGDRSIKVEKWNQRLREVMR